MKNSISLEKIKSYNNEDLICRFLDIYEIDEAEAINIFEETKKWLWLCSNAKFDLIIDDSLIIIDEMWHNFILFTKEYDAFCKEYLEVYIHHQPTTKLEKDNWNKDVLKSISELKKNLKNQYEYIYDNLGEETLNKWYVEIADKYTKDYIKTITK